MKPARFRYINIVAAACGTAFLWVAFLIVLTPTHFLLGGTTGINPQVRAITITSELPIYDPLANSGVSKTVYFNNADSSGLLTTTFEISGTPIFSLTAGPAFDHSARIYTAAGTLVKFPVTYTITTLHGSQSNVTYIVTNGVNLSTAVVISYVQDTSSPSVAIVSPSEGTYLSTTQLTVLGTTGDLGSGVQQVWGSTGTTTWSTATLAVTGSHVLAANWTYSSTFPVVNCVPYTVSIYAVDNLNTQSLVARRVITLDGIGPAGSAIFTPNVPLATWGNNPTLDVVWQGFADGCSLSGYRYLFTDTLAVTLPRSGDIFTTVAHAGATLPDGTWYLNVVARDIAGNWGGTAHMGPFQIDTVSPTSQIAIPVDTEYYNQLTAISGTASDTGGSGLDWVELRIVSGTLNWDGSAWDVKETWLAATGTTNWSLTGSLPVWESGRAYTIYAQAIDSAGNVQLVPDQATFYYDAAAPWSNINTPAHNAFYNAAFTVAGTAGDTGGAGLQGVSIRILHSGLNWNGTSWVAGETWLATSGGGTWSRSTGLPVWQHGELYTLRSRAVDNVLNTETPGLGNTFGYDTQPPVISSPNIRLASGADKLYIAPLTPTKLFYTNTLVGVQDFYVEGNQADAFAGIQEAVFSGPVLSCARPANDTDADYSGHYCVSSADNTNGSITVNSYDRAGNTAEQTYTYELDGTPPTSDASSPVQSGAASIPVSWTASDSQSGVSSVALWYKKGTSGSWQFDSTQSGASGLFSFVPGDGDGLYSFSVLATDNLGNTEVLNPLVPDAETLYDTQPPASSVLSPVDGAFYRTGFSVSGIASDGTGSGVEQVEIRILRGTLNWNGSAWVAGETWLIATGTTNWSSGGSLPAWQDGNTYTMRSRSTDRVGNVEIPGSGVAFGFDTQPPEIDFPRILPGTSDKLYVASESPTTLFYTNTMTFPQNFYIEGYQTDDFAGIQRATFSGPVLSCSRPPDDSNAVYGGRYCISTADTSSGIISVTAYDKAGNTRVQTYTYIFDGIPPESMSAAPPFANGTSIPVTWVTTDTQSGADTTTLWYQKVGGGSWTAAMTQTGSSGSFSFIPPDGDGRYLLATRARDFLENQESIPVISETQVIYDTQLPASIIRNPVANEFYSTTFVISGTAQDVGEAGLQSVKLRVLSDTLNWNGIGWIADEFWLTTTGTLTWTRVANLPMWGSGDMYGLQTQSVDRAGNIEELGVMTPFGFDIEPPHSSLSWPEDGTFYKAVFMIDGTARDSGGSGVQSVAIRVVHDGLNWDSSNWITAETWLTTTGGTYWSRNSGLPVWQSGELYTVYSRAVDKMGFVQPVPDVHTFGYDTAFPTSTINFPVDGLIYNYPFTLTGNAGDTGGAGLQSIGIRILSGTLNWDGQDWIAAETWLTATGVSDWSFATDLPVWTSGHTYTLRSLAWDNAGNQQVVNSDRVVGYDTDAPIISQPGISVPLGVTGSLYVDSARPTQLFYTNTFTGVQRFYVRGTQTDTFAGIDRATFTGPILSCPKPPDVKSTDYQAEYCISGVDSASGMIAVTAYDHAGNTTVQTYTYVLDNTPPFVKVISDTGFANRSPVTITWLVTDTQSGVLSTTLWYKRELSGTWEFITTTPASSISHTYVWDVPDDEGVYYFAATAVDQLNNAVSFPAKPDTQLVYDAAAPVSTVDMPIDGAFYNTPFVIKGTAYDVGLAGLLDVEIRILSGTLNWDGSTWITSEEWLTTTGTTDWTRSGGLPDWVSGQTYTLYARAIDSANNIENPSISYSFGYDTQPPEVQVTYPISGAFYNHLYAIAGTAYDVGGVGLEDIQIRVAAGDLSWDGEDWVTSEVWLTTTGTLNWSRVENAVPWQHGYTYTLYTRAADRLGNVTPFSEYVFGYDIVSPTIVMPGIETEVGHKLYVSDRSMPTLFYTNTLESPQYFYVTGTQSDDFSGIAEAVFGESGLHCPAPSSDPNVNFRGRYCISNMDSTDGVITVTTYDRAGNTGEQTYAYVLDSLPAIAWLESAPSLVTNTAIVELSWVATDTQSGVADVSLWYKSPHTGWSLQSTYQVSGNNAGNFDFEFQDGAGYYVFAATAGDHVGNWEAAPIISETQVLYQPAEHPPYEKIYLPGLVRFYPLPVPIGKIEIGQGESYVYTQHVDVNLEATVVWDTVQDVALRNYQESWVTQTFSSPLSWALLSGNSGVRIVDAQFIASMGGKSSIVSDKVYLFLNGDFNAALSPYWSTHQGGFGGNGSGLPVQRVSGMARLGDPGYKDAAIPIGYGTLMQAFTVPADLSYKYLKLYYDLYSEDFTYRQRQFYDTFEITFNQAPADVRDQQRASACIESKGIPLVLKEAGLAFCDGALPKHRSQEISLDLSAFAGQSVTVYITLWSREYEPRLLDDRGWYNSWVDIDNVRMEP